MIDWLCTSSASGIGARCTDPSNTELGRGLLRKMLRDLDIDKKEF